MPERSGTSKRVTRETQLENDTYVCNLLIDPRLRRIRCIDDSAAVLSAALNERQTLRPEVVFLFINKCTSAPYELVSALFRSHLPLH